MSVSKKDRWVKIAGACGIASPIITLALITTAIILYPPFDWTTNALSDLGVQESSALIFNSSLIVGGILSLLFTFGLKQFLWKHWLGKIGVLIFAVATINMVAIGVFSENFGYLHYYVSVMFFMSLPASQFFMAAALARGLSEKALGTFTLVAGLIALLVWVFPWRSAAIPEIIAALAAAMWSIVLGVRLLRH